MNETKDGQSLVMTEFRNVWMSAETERQRKKNRETKKQQATEKQNSQN